MNKNEIAHNITGTYEVSRTIAVNYKIDYVEGQVITLDKAESWTKAGMFTPETFGEYEYTFIPENKVAGHEVDYDNEEECSELGCEDCDQECEVLLPAGTRFVITRVATDLDFEEMGYYEITIKFI